MVRNRKNYRQAFERCNSSLLFSNHSIHFPVNTYSLRELEMAHVLVSPLNWGLGHATRDIPIITSLLAHNHEVTVAASGNALTVLKKEFPVSGLSNFPITRYGTAATGFSSRNSLHRSPLSLRGFPKSGRTLQEFSKTIGTT